MEETRTLSEWLTTLANEDRAAWDQIMAERRAQGCLTFPRLEAALYQNDWTVAEWRHLDDCERCRHQRDVMAADLWHPAAAQVILHALGRRDGDGAAEVGRHLAADRCIRCTRIHDRAGVAVIRKVLDAARKRLTVAGSGLMPLPTRAVLMASTDRLAFRVSATDPASALTVTVRETEGRRLVARVEAPIADVGRTVHVAVLGTGEAGNLQADLVLTARRGRAWAQHDFGAFDACLTALGRDCIVLATLDEPAADA